MPNMENLQSQVNILLGDNTPHEFKSPVKPINQISNQPQIRPSTQQEEQVATPSQQAYLGEGRITVDKKNNTYIYVVAFIVLIGIGIAGVTTFRTEVLGPLTYEDCLGVPDNTIMKLDPKYCVTPDGKVFYEDLSLIEDKSGSIPAPYDESIIPGRDSGY